MGDDFKIMDYTNLLIVWGFSFIISVIIGAFGELPEPIDYFVGYVAGVIPTIWILTQV